MATIVIADDTRHYNGRDLDVKPLGGTESSVIRLACALAQRGHAVTVLNHCRAPIEHQGVHWVPLSQPAPEACDLFLPVQHPRLFHLVRRPRRLAVWSLWRPNNLRHYKQLPLMWWYRPTPLIASEYQRREYSCLLPRRGAIVTIPLGLPDDIRGLPPLSAAPPPEAIFASNPARNLLPLVEIWIARVLPKRPDAILHVYAIHDLKPGDDPWRAWGGIVLPADAPPAARAAIRIHPTAARTELMAAMRRARVMPYLGHQTEAYCLALAEAQALGLPCVVAPVAVLPERVIDGETGFVRGDPESFAEATLALLSDDALWRRQHEAALKRQQGISWAEYAARFEAALLADL
jgi:glycosyltransferase involved in cell wall biosynthesis